MKNIVNAFTINPPRLIEIYDINALLILIISGPELGFDIRVKVHSLFPVYISLSVVMWLE